jgi:type I restriction enzyme, S subunit
MMRESLKNLPEGWKWVRLGEVAILVKNISHKGSKPYLEIGDIDIHNKKYSIKEKESPNHCIKAKRGNIVISKVRPTRGAISLINEAFLYVSPAFSVLEANNSKFLFYSLSMRQFCNYLGTLETGTTYPSVNDEDVLSYELPLPPLPEQQKIAEILETVDNAIEKTDKIIEKYKRIKQGLMQDLLTKGIDENGNIRSEKTHKFKDSPLGKIPEEWEVVRLGEICDIKLSRVDKTKPRETSESCFVIILDVYGGNGITWIY